MKTAEEWANEYDNLYRKYDKDADEQVGEGIVPSEHIHEIIIKQIQLDAWKQGMTDAADIVVPSKPKRAGVHHFLISKKEAILHARDEGGSL